MEPAVLPQPPPPPTERSDIDLSRFELLGGMRLSPEEVESKLEAARAPEQLGELKLRVADIAKAFSSNYQLKVLPSEDGRWSLAIDQEAQQAVTDLLAGRRDTVLDIPRESFRPKAIMYNLDDLALASEDTIFSKLRHEATHAKETDLRYLFEGYTYAAKAGIPPAAFALVQLAFEDARVMQRQVGNSEGAKENLIRSLAGPLGEIEARINQQSLTRQLTLNLVYGRWLQGENLKNLVDPDVRAASDALGSALERYVLSNRADENFALLKNEVWPVAQTLAAAEVTQEMEREILKEVAQLSRKEERHRKRVATRVLNTFRWALFMGPRQFEPSPEMKDLYEASGGRRGSPTRQGLSSQAAALVRDQEIIATHLSDHKLETGYLTSSFDLTKIPPEQQRTLTEIRAHLAPTSYARIDAEARRKLLRSYEVDLERELPVGIDLAKRTPDGPVELNFSAAPTPEVLAAQEQGVADLLRSLSLTADQVQSAAKLSRKEERAAAHARAAELQSAIAAKELRKQGFTPEEKQHFENFKRLEHSVIGRLPEFLQELLPLLPKRRTYGFTPDLHHTGSRLDKRAVVRKGPLGDGEVWRRRTQIDSPDPRMFVTLLIDNSPSMEGAKVEQAKKTALFWARALKEMDVPFSIKMFGGTVTDLKDFSADYDDPATRIKPTLMSKLDASTNGTNISAPLQRAEKEMDGARKKLPDSFGAIFVLSDGGANQGLRGEELRTYIAALREKYVVMNFMLSSTDEEVQDARKAFGHKYVVAPKSFDRLPVESIKVLGGVIREASQRNGGVRY